MTRSIVSALAIAAVAAMAGNAFADDIAVDPHPLKSVKSRAQVQAELKASGPNYNNQVRSSKSSKQLADEYVAARREVAAINGEDSGSAYLSRVGRQRKASVMGAPPR